MALLAFFEGAKGSMLGLMDLFAGGALSTFSIFALGIMPYITSSIIINLLTVAIPHLEKLSKEGENGRRKITQYTRYLTIAIAIMQSTGLTFLFHKGGGGYSGGNPTNTDLFAGNYNTQRVLLVVLTLTTGTALLMWMGELITQRGIGNGISLLIFIGIVADLPNAIRNAGRMIANDKMSVFVGLALVFIMVLVTAGAIVITTGQRRIPVQYPRQIKGRGMTGGTRTYLPLRVNHAGVIPIIFASSILMLPGTIAEQIKIPGVESAVTWLFNPYGLPYNLMYAGMIVFFAFFYTAIVFNPKDTADQLKKHSGFIPGYRPGERTAEYIDYVLTRITVIGAISNSSLQSCAWAPVQTPALSSTCPCVCMQGSNSSFNRPAGSQTHP